MSWTFGYVTEIEYTSGYYRQGNRVKDSGAVHRTEFNAQRPCAMPCMLPTDCVLNQGFASYESDTRWKGKASYLDSSFVPSPDSPAPLLRARPPLPIVRECRFSCAEAVPQGTSITGLRTDYVRVRFGRGYGFTYPQITESDKD